MVCCAATSLRTGASTAHLGIACGAARMEAAARRGIERARHLSGSGQPLVSLVGVRRQGGGEPRSVIGMQRLGAQLEAIGKLDELPEIHDGNAALICAIVARSCPMRR